MNRHFNNLATMLVVGIGLFPPSHVLAQDTAVLSWTEQKCVLYTAAWNHLAPDGVPDGVSEKFMTAHDAFLSSGCLDRGRVCPGTPRELEIADILSLMAVADGVAGSFLPFNCTD